VLQHTVLQPREHLLCQHDKAGGQNAALIKAAAERQTDDSRGPQSGRRCQSLHILPFGDDDRTGTDEADSGNNLRAQTRHISEIMHIQIQILTGQRGDRCTDADEDMRAEACRTALVRALDADDAAADKCTGETHKYGERGNAAQTVKNR